MIELRNRHGESFSINPNSITAVRIEDIVTVIDVGSKTYYVKESYNEVILRIKGSTLETK